jgi:uncharacterized damage-inducible protein DinB
MGNGYSEQNAAWREKLVALARRLSEKDMGRPAGGAGWTVTGLLGHMAFYDQRALTLLEKWKRDGISPSALDVDIVNDALRPFLNAVAPREMKRLAVEAAEAIDAAIDSLEPGLLSRIETEGKPVRLNRAVHREHHVAQIENALA